MPPRIVAHPINPQNIDVPGSKYYVVLRHPYERALSAFSFQKQNGEDNDETGNTDTLFTQRYNTLEELVMDNPNLEYLPLLAPAHQYKQYFAQKEGEDRPMRPICYTELDTEWPTIMKELGCDSECALAVSNTSNSRSQTLGPKTKEFIDTHLAEDLRIYHHYCGHTQST